MGLTTNYASQINSASLARSESAEPAKINQLAELQRDNLQQSNKKTDGRLNDRGLTEAIRRAQAKPSSKPRLKPIADEPRAQLEIGVPSGLPLPPLTQTPDQPHIVPLSGVQDAGEVGSPASIDRAANQATDYAVDRAANQATDHAVDRAANHATDHAVDRAAEAPRALDFGTQTDVKGVQKKSEPVTQAASEALPAADVERASQVLIKRPLALMPVESPLTVQTALLEAQVKAAPHLERKHDTKDVIGEVGMVPAGARPSAFTWVSPPPAATPPPSTPQPSTTQMPQDALGASLQNLADPNSAQIGTQVSYRFKAWEGQPLVELRFDADQPQVAAVQVNHKGARHALVQNADQLTGWELRFDPQSAGEGGHDRQASTQSETEADQA